MSGNSITVNMRVISPTQREVDRVFREWLASKDGLITPKLVKDELVPKLAALWGVEVTDAG